MYQQAKDAYEKRNIRKLDMISKEIKYHDLDKQLINDKQNEYIDYPDTNNDNFNQIIFNKKEFNRTKYKQTTKSFDDLVEEKCNKDKFMLTDNQKFLKHFMSPHTRYNSVLLYHSVGTGKTCSSISTAEQLIPYYKKKVFVLVSSNLKDNFKKQIFDISKVNVVNGLYEENSNQCTGMSYLNMIPDRNAMNKQELEGKVKKLINERYQFKGFMEFANDYERLKEAVDAVEKTPAKREKRFNEKLRDIYSNRVFIIDEVHNIRLASESSKKQVPPKIEHVLREAENVKLILLTATPMFNSVTEIVWLLNYMLINDKKPTLKSREVFENGVLTKEGKIKIIEASRGRVSYMRGESPYTFPFRLYPSVNNNSCYKMFTSVDKPKLDIFNLPITTSNKLEELELVKSVMSSYQYDVYKRFEQRLKKTDLENDENDVVDVPEYDDSDESTDIQMGLQVSNIVFPILKQSDDIKHYYGKESFEKCLPATQHGRSKLLKVSYDTKIVERFGEFLAPDKIGEYSSKIKTILDCISNSSGIVYIYSSLLYSGIIPLAIALEHMGFHKYGGQNILTGVNNIKPFKVGNKQAQYVILSANSSISPNNNEEISILKNPNNKQGEIVKVVIGSSVATEGIDFKNIREVHILEPWYHFNKIEQIIGRAVRNCSHIGLPLENRNVTIYSHVNVPLNTKRETIDVRIYRIAEHKQKKIKKVETILRKNAIDCMLNKNVLYFDPDKLNKKINLVTSQNTIIKNYIIGDKNKQKTTCYPKQSSEHTKVDNSTFSTFFLHDDIEIYMAYICTLYSSKSTYTYKEIKFKLQSFIDEVEEDVLTHSLEQMLSQKRKLFDFKHRPGYLIYRSNKYIFQETDKADTRMTVEERENNEYSSLSRRRLDIEYYMPFSNTHEDKSSVKIIQQIHKKVLHFSQVFGEEVDVYIPYIYDYFIDRLEPKDLLKVAEHIFINDKNDKSIIPILKSMLSANLFITENIEEVRYFVNYYDKERFYMFKNKELIKCPLIEKNNIEKLELDLQTEVHKRFHSYEGYITPDLLKDRFKTIVRNKKGEVGSSSGSVCFVNSVLTIKKMKDLIAAIEPSLNIPKSSVVKAILCDIYEIILRKNLCDKLVRPYQYFLLKGQQTKKTREDKKKTKKLKE